MGKLLIICLLAIISVTAAGRVVYSQSPLAQNAPTGATVCAYNTSPLPPLVAGTYNIIQCADACQTAPHIFVPISITSATTTKIQSGAANTKIYLCYLFLSTTIANSIAVVEGTGATCGGSTTGIIGGATAANGVALAAMSSVSLLANFSAIGVTAIAADNVCLITSSVGPLAGVAVFAQQ